MIMARNGEWNVDDRQCATYSSMQYMVKDGIVLCFRD
jgi:hypothetical protein